MAKPARTITLRNRQTIRRLNSRLLRRIARALLHEVWPHGNFDLAFHVVAASEMTHLNETYLRHKGSTDVITFDYTGNSAFSLQPLAFFPLHGEIFVCLDEAVSQARRFHATWQSELVRYIVHGVLHLLGYDDADGRARRRMKAAEDTLVHQLARQFDFHSLAVTP